jgi:hypothetical protein
MDTNLTYFLINLELGTAIAIMFAQFFKEYEEKITAIDTVLIGNLINAKEKLVRDETDRHRHGELQQEKEFDNLVDFMQKSNFLKYANEREEILEYQEFGAGKIKRIALFIGCLAVPTFFLMQDTNPPLFVIGYFWLLINLLFLMDNFGFTYRMIKRVNTLHTDYVRVVLLIIDSIPCHCIGVTDGYRFGNTTNKINR